MMLGPAQSTPSKPVQEGPESSKHGKIITEQSL